MARAKPFLLQLRELLTFLGNLWGLLAGISVLFPLSASLFELIPLGEKVAVARYFGFVRLPKGLPPVLATVVTLFLLLQMFAARATVRQMLRKDVLALAGFSFFLGVLSLVGYMLLYVQYHSPDVLNSTLIQEFGLLFLYCGFFALITLAFTSIGLYEFLAEDTQDGEPTH
jgi:DMSO/TMAO reductase YedYZ heme-binding membrane subunit